MVDWNESYESTKETLFNNTRYTHEHLLIVSLIITSAYAYMRTTQWPESTAMWPRYLSIYIFFGSVLTLFRNYLPSWMQPYLQEKQTGTSITPKDDEASDLVEDTDKGPSYTRTVMADHIASAILILGYALISYLFGMFWATIVFILAYCLWFKISPLKSVILLLVGVSVAYGFESILNLPIMEGMLNA